MRAHYFQHVPFEGLGSIAAWLGKAGVEITCTRFFETADLPDAADIDFLIVMGGPMSVNDEDLFPWLAREKAFIRAVMDLGKPVLGICLGAQLIASALDARVYPNSQKEIGWLPIRGMASSDAAVFSFPTSAKVFHWHGETFDLPAGAVHLAESAGCKHQAFQVGANVLGLQFHLETTPDSARALVAHCRDELMPAPYVQPEQVILAAPPETYAAANRLMAEVLAYLFNKAVMC